MYVHVVSILIQQVEHNVAQTCSFVTVDLVPTHIAQYVYLLSLCSALPDLAVASCLPSLYQHSILKMEYSKFKR